MAASSHGVGDLGELSTNLGLPSEDIASLANRSEECTTLLLKMKNYCKGQVSKEEKYRSEIASLRRARVNAEQQFAQLEKQLISCNTKLEVESKRTSELQQELEQTATSLAEKQKRLHEVEGIQVEASTNYSRVSKLNEQLETEKLGLLAVVERKNQEIANLNDEWKGMSEKLSLANSAKFEAQAKVDEILSQETSFKFRENRMMQEKELMEKQSEWLNNELKSKTDELAKLRKEKSAQVLELQGQLDQQKEEVVHLKSSLDSLKETNKEMEERMASYLQKLKDTQEQLAKMEERYKLELSSQSKLASLYKEEAEEAKGKSAELLSAVEELQKLVKEANDGRVEIESKLEEEQSSHAQSTKETEAKISQLEKELENANDLLAAARQRGTAPMTPQELTALSPTAAATSSFLKTGMTLTQMYSQYVEVSDLLQQEKDETARLKQYLDQILKEIEEKAPIFKKQRLEYEQALQSADQLSRRLDTALVEHEELRVEADESRKHSEHLKRENERLKTLSADLSQQVQVLLKECEEARQGVLSPSLPAEPMSSAEVSSSSQVISQHLVSFRNIEELQQQNQRLLGVVRELSVDNEKREGEGAIVEVKKQLDVTLKEVEDLKEARSRQMQMVEALVRQRDMYRVLLANTGQTPIPLSDVDPALLASSPLTQIANKSSVDETRHALNDLQKLFEEYKTEKKNDETKLSERLDTLQVENTELQGRNARLTSQLQFEEEKYKMLQSSADGFKKEAAAATDKAQKLQVASGKAQLTVDKYSQDLIENRDKLNKLEVTFENMKCERDMLKEAEVRLLQENKSLLEQQKAQNAILTNLQTMQNNLERANFETRTRLEAQLESAQRELALLKSRAESNQQHHKHVITTKENRIEELQVQLETEMKSNLEARDRLISATRERDSLQLKVEAFLKASEKRLEDVLTNESPTDQGAEEETARRQLEEQHAVRRQELEVKLADTQAKLKVLEEQVEQGRKHADQFKAMSAANEEALKELNKTSDDFKKITEGKLKTAEEANTRLGAQVRELQSAKDKAFTEKSMLEKENEHKTKELQEMLGGIRRELEEATRKAQLSGAGELAAKEEMKEQARMAAEAQEKYERELLLHAQDVAALTAAKEQLQNYTSSVGEGEQRAEAAEKRLADLQASWDEQKKMLAAESKKKEARCADLVNQNSVLHGQLEKLSAQLTSSRKSSASEPVPSPAETAAGTESKSTEELWEIIRFVRREKEIAETQGELSRSESIRFQQRCDFMEKQLAEAERRLSTEHTESQADALSPAQHAEVMEKVAKLSELAEENKLLADTKTKLELKVKGLETKIQKVESDVQPLEESNRALTTQKDALLAEKTALKNEILRWTAKTNQLLEQYKNIDPDEHKKLVESRRQLLQQSNALRADNQKAKAQIDALKADASKAQGEAAGLKVEAKKSQEQVEAARREHQAELSKARDEADTLRKTVEEKIKTLNQVKRIARRYKTQYDELKKATGNQSKQPEPAEGEAAGSAAAAAGAEPLTAEPTLSADGSSHEAKIKELTEKVESLQGEVKKAQEANEQKETAIKEKEDKNKRMLLQVRGKLQQLTGERDKLSNELEELKKKEQAAAADKETAGQRATELEMRLQVLKSQYEGKVARLDRELKEANDLRQEKDAVLDEMHKRIDELQQSANAEVDQLTQKNQQQQKQIQQLQVKLAALTAAAAAAASAAASAGTRPTPGDSPGADVGAPQEGLPPPATNAPVTSSVPPTATIKPTTTPSPSPANKHTATPKASIRPMTVAPAAPAPTPTATVLPTVTPTSTPQEPPARVALAPPTSVPATMSVRPITSSAAQSSQGAESFQAAVEVSVSSPQDTGEASVSSSGENDRAPAMSAAVVPGKRPREDSDTADRPSSGDEELRAHREPRGKKIKVTLTESAPGPSEVDLSDELVLEGALAEPQVELEFQPPDQEEPPQQQQQQQGPREVLLIESDDDEDADKEEEDEEEGELEFEGEGEEEVMEEEEVEEGEEEDEEDADEYDYVEGEEPEQEDGDGADPEQQQPDAAIDVVEVIDDEPDAEMAEEDREAEEGEEPEAEQDGEGGGADRGDALPEEPEQLEEQGELVEVDDDDDEEEGESRPEDSVPDVDEDEVIQEEPSSTQSRPSTSAARQSEAAPSGRPAVAEGRTRLLSARHMAPFSFPQGHPAPGPFDETDDCQVPSTPTLFVPKRNDGFAEAVSSPHLHRPFSFAPPAESSMDQWVLSDHGLQSMITGEGPRVDDTRVDLMGSTEDSSRLNRPSAAVPTGSEAPTQTNPTPTSTTSDSRQPSLESMEGDAELSSLVPTITVTPARQQQQSAEPSDEAAEQNVPVSRAWAESIEQEVIDLIDDEGEEARQLSGTADAGDKSELEPELELQESAEVLEAKPSASTDSSGPSTSVESASADSSAGPSSSSSSQLSHGDAQPASSSGAASSSQDSMKSKAPVVQLRRSAAPGAPSASRGGQQRPAQPATRGRDTRPGRGGRGLHRSGM